MMRSIPMIWAVLALSGCAVEPVFTPPQIALPDRYALLEPVSRAAPADVSWWQHFNDPLLTGLVDTALADNLDLATTNARLREAAAVARRDGNRLAGGADLSTSLSDFGDSATLGVSSQIGLAGEERWRAAGAAQRLEAARFDLQSAQRSLLAEVGVAYVDLRFSQASLVSHQQDLESRQRTLADVRRLLDAGLATQLDLLRAQSLVSETQAQIPALFATMVRQRNRISTLLGQPVGNLPVDLGYQGRQPAPVMRAVTGVPADLLRARPDIQQAERLYAAAVSDLGAAEAARYPSLSLRGTVTAPLQNGMNGQSLIAGLSMPLFNQPALAASVDAANARVDQAYLLWQRAVLSAIEEVENGQASLQASTAEQAEARNLVDLNRRALDLSRNLLSTGGNITVLDVLDRERSLSDARLRLARSQRDQAINYIILQTVIGLGHTVNEE
jgi:outer membrane protein, multidrug efflux system